MESKTLRLVEGFKALGLWDVRGLNAEISRKTGFTASYAGKVFKGVCIPADKFFISVCEKFGICADWVLKGKKPVLATSDPLGVNKGFEQGNRLVSGINSALPDLRNTNREHEQLDILIYRDYGGVKADIWEVIKNLSTEEAIRVLQSLRAQKFVCSPDYEAEG
jgi:hypothetical protein